MSKFALDHVQAALPDSFTERYVDRTGGEWAVVKRERLVEVLRHLKDDPALDFKLFVQAECSDRLMLPESDPRFEVVYVMRSLSRNEYVRLKVRVGGEAPEVPSATAVYQGANWWERLIWDFYGVRFTAHPDLRRVLLFEQFVGHPLRKDYPLRERQPLVPERPLKDIFRGPGTSGLS